MVTIEIEQTKSDAGTETTVLNPSFTPPYVTSSNEQNYQVKPFEDSTVFGSPKTDLDELTEFMLESADK